MLKDKKEKIKIAIVLFTIIISFGFSIAMMLRYNIEGEKNMPFTLSEIVVISNAEGEAKKDNPEGHKWNLDIVQYNDIYLQIIKNESYKKNTYIESINIENFDFTEPNVGNTRLYMPSSTEKNLFSYEDNYLIKRKLTFNGADNNNMKTLEISNQGGNVVFRVANLEVGEYVSNDDAEIAHNGTIITKTPVTLDDLKIQLEFDVVIKTNMSTYRGRVSLELPCGDILTEGTSQLDKKDCSDIIFKRENY